MKDLVQETGLKVDFGGGIQTEQDLQELIEAGANQVVIGSLCVKQTDLVYNWIQKHGVERFVLALDTDGTQLKIKGWQEGSGVSLEELMERFKGLKGLTILTTDIRRDGTGKGPSLELYTSLVKQYPDQRWIASGGVESLADLKELRKAGCYGCVVGKALLEGKITLNELNEFNNGSI
jgi:phosphoribosylformimino-5-aminoimidazole carboxamide ribotide isomerase